MPNQLLQRLAQQRRSRSGLLRGTDQADSSVSPKSKINAQRQVLGALTTDISTGHWDYARKTFRRNTDAVSTEVDSSGNTPLHWIMKAESPPLDFAELLLASYPDAAMIRNKSKGSTPLHIACEEYKMGEGAKIEMLLELAGHGGIANMKDNKGQLPIDIFLKKLEANNFKLSFPSMRLLELFPEFLALWKATYGECVAAAAMKQWDVVKQLLRSKLEGPLKKDLFGMIPIDYAVYYNAPRSLMALLAKAYPISEGIVLVPMVRERLWSQCVKMLNANPVAGEWKDTQGRVLLNHAFLEGADIEILQELRIASPESVASALAFALEKGHPDMARALMQAGCDIKFYLEDFKREITTSSLSSQATTSTVDAESIHSSSYHQVDLTNNAESNKTKRFLPVKDALIAAHTIVSARLTDIDVTGTNNALGMILSRRDVMEFHRQMMENQGLRSGRSWLDSILDASDKNDGDDSDDDDSTAASPSHSFLYHRFDAIDTPGTLHYESAATLSLVYDKLEKIQREEKLGEVTRPINAWIFKHIFPGLVRRDDPHLRKDGKIARKLQVPADSFLRQDRMPVRKVNTSDGTPSLTSSSDDDTDGLLPSTSCAFVTEFAYAHILHLMAKALDKTFHKSVSVVLADGVQACTYQAAPPKTVAKMISNIATRHAAMKRPRPAHNVDCLRCLINYIDASQMLEGFAQMQNSFKVLHVTNGYADWYDAKPAFGYRAVTMHVVYEPKMTFGQMVRISPKVQAYFDNYVSSVDQVQKAHAKVVRSEWRAFCYKGV